MLCGRVGADVGEVEVLRDERTLFVDARFGDNAIGSAYQPLIEDCGNVMAGVGEEAPERHRYVLIELESHGIVVGLPARCGDALARQLGGVL